MTSLEISSRAFVLMAQLSERALLPDSHSRSRSDLQTVEFVLSMRRDSEGEIGKLQ